MKNSKEYPQSLLQLKKYKINFTLHEEEFITVRVLICKFDTRSKICKSDPCIQVCKFDKRIIYMLIHDCHDLRREKNANLA